MAYVEFELPFETDQASLGELFFDYVMTAIPGWVPADSPVVSIIGEACARLAAELYELMLRVPDEIFSTYLTTMVQLPLREAERATADSTWTLRPFASGETPVDRVIPAGTIVGVPLDSETLLGFETTVEVTVPAGSLSTAAGGVPLVAREIGADRSGLNGGVELIDRLEFVDTVAIAGQTIGGTDGETPDKHRDRGSSRLRLRNSSVVFARDAADLVRDEVPGVFVALGLDNYIPGTNERQSIAVTSATGGTFTLTFAGQTTTATAYNATAGIVQTRLEALSNVAPGDVLVTGGPLDTAPVIVEFIGALDATNHAQMTTSSSLSGAGAAVAVTTPEAGVSENDDAERALTVAVRAADGQPVDSDTKAEADALLQSQREENFLVYIIDPTYTNVTAAFTFVPRPGYDPVDVKTRAQAAVLEYLSPAQWGLPPEGDDVVWETGNDVIYVNEIISTVDLVPGVRRVVSATLNGVASNLTLYGDAPLPNPVAVTGTPA